MKRTKYMLTAKQRRAVERATEEIVTRKQKFSCCAVTCSGGSRLRNAYSHFYHVVPSLWWDWADGCTGDGRDGGTAPEALRRRDQRATALLFFAYAPKGWDE